MNRNDRCVPGRWLLRAGVAGILVLGMAAETAAQSADRPERRKDGWETKWRLSLGSEYDDNLFGLKPGQKVRLEDGGARYTDMPSPRDLIHTVGLRGELRGPGVAGRRLRLGAEAEYEAYTLNPRRSNFAFGAFAAQKLTRRDEIGLTVSHTPSEFRRSYLAGDGSYQAGIAQTTRGRIEYERQLLRGKRGRPELSATAAVVGRRRTFADFPWRDRRELGGEVAAELVLGKRVGVELSAGRVRASHDPHPEPVLDVGLSTRTLKRDFEQTELGAETRFWFGKRRLALRYEHRLREYLASVAEDGVYGGRQDTRRTYGAELDLSATRNARLVLGGAYEEQTTLRPGRGDTGDEADFVRPSVYLRLDLSR